MVLPDHVCPYGLKAKDLLEREDETSYRPVAAVLAVAFAEQRRRQP